VLRTLRHRDFRLLWIGQSVSLIGDGIYLVAIAWLVYVPGVRDPERTPLPGPRAQAISST
jgi:hypothetical protein